MEKVVMTRRVAALGVGWEKGRVDEARKEKVSLRFEGHGGMRHSGIRSHSFQRRNNEWLGHGC